MLACQVREPEFRPPAPHKCQMQPWSATSVESVKRHADLGLGTRLSSQLVNSAQEEPKKHK